MIPILGDGIKLARQIALNDRFEENEGWNEIKHWERGVTTYDIGAPTTTHSGGGNMLLMLVESDSSLYIVRHKPNGEYYYGDQLRRDYFDDGRAHNVRFGGWGKTASAASGDMTLALMTCGSYEFSLGFPADGEWHFLETAELTFTGSCNLFSAVTKPAGAVDGLFYLSSPRLYLDEMALHVGHSARFQGRSLYSAGKTAIGNPRLHLGQLDGFTLPVDGVNSSQACLLNEWHREGYPLIMRLDTSSAAAPVHHVTLTGKRSPMTKMDGVHDDLWSGSLVLEGWR